VSQVLYVSGALARAAALASVVEPLRRASKTPLHETLVRNEVAYFGCARQVRAKRRYDGPRQTWTPRALFEST